MAGQDEVAAAFLAEHERRLDKSRVLLDSYAAEIANEMKANAPWTDRTANARNSLRATTVFTRELLGLILAGGGPPDYVKYLELANAGQYAIIRPTLEAYSGRICKDLVEIWT